MAGEWTEEARVVAPELLELLERWQESYWSLSRPDLCMSLGCSDRVLRAAVAELRKSGHLVVVAPEGGYRIARSEVEVSRFVDALRERISSLETVIGTMEKVAGERFGEAAGQLELMGTRIPGRGRMEHGSQDGDGLGR